MIPNPSDESMAITYYFYLLTINYFDSIKINHLSIPTEVLIKIDYEFSLKNSKPFTII